MLNEDGSLYMCGSLTLTVDAIGDHAEKWAISNEKQEKDKEGRGRKSEK